jgi:hypothetical protein
MTVSKFFGILARLLLYPFILYWAYVYYFANEKNQDFGEIINNKGIVLISFVLFCIFAGIMLICFVAFCIKNSGKALTIVFSPKYLYTNHWKDIEKQFD